MNYTIPLSPDKFKKDIFKIIKKIEDISFSNKSIIETSPYILSEKPFLRLLSLYDRSAGLERIVLSTMLESFYKSEKISGDSGNLSLKLSISLLTNSLRDSSLNSEKIEKINLNEIKDILKIKSLKPAMKDIKYLLKDSVEDDFTRDLVLECISRGGLMGKIFIEETRYSESSIEVTSGYNFNVQVPDFFFTEKEKWSQEYVSCVIIDGFINDVHEIHHLLEFFSRDISPLVIFARGFSNDVLSTLRANLDRGTLNIIPMKPIEAIENINLLNDIFHVVGGNLISPTKGDLISSICIDDIPKVDLVDYSNKQVKILNSATIQNVKIHRENLKKRKEKSTKNDLIDIFDKRIRGLADNCIVVRLSKIHAEKRETIDYAFRAIESMTRNGYVRTSKVTESLREKQDILSRALYSVLSADKRKIYPSSSIYSACEIAVSCILNLKKCELAIIFD